MVRGFSSSIRSSSSERRRFVVAAARSGTYFIFFVFCDLPRYFLLAQFDDRLAYDHRAVVSIWWCQGACIFCRLARHRSRFRVRRNDRECVCVCDLLCSCPSALLYMVLYIYAIRLAIWMLMLRSYFVESCIYSAYRFNKYIYIF